MTLTDRVGSWYRLTRAIVLQRCPACREGRVFRGAVAMNERCPVCGHVFQEDEGFFLGAITVVVAIGMPLVAFTFVFASDVVRLVLGPRWEGSVILFQVLAPAAFVEQRQLAP